MRDPYTFKPRLYFCMSVLTMLLSAYLILAAAGYVPLLWPFAHEAWNLLAGIVCIFLGVFMLFRDGDPRKAYAQPALFFGRPDTPVGAREELADFYRAYKAQAKRGLLIGKKWIVYSSFAQTFCYPRTSLRKVIKEITIDPSAGESGKTEWCLILHFDGSERYVGKDGHSIRSSENQIDRWIVYIRKHCADLPIEYFDILFNTDNFRKK